MTTSLPARALRRLLVGVLAWPCVAVAQDADEIVVEGEATEAAGSGTTVAVDERFAASSELADVLASVTGVTVRRLGGPGAFAALGLRGSSFRQVQVHLDGVPLNPDGVGVADLSEIPTALVRSVSVWRGFAPATFGASGIGGVVDLSTHDDVPLTLRAVSGTLRTWQGSGVVGGALGRSGVRGTLAVDALGSAGDFSYVSDNGTPFTPDDDGVRVRVNNDQLRISGLGRLRLGDERFGGGLTELVTVRDQGIPGPASLPTDSVRLRTVRHLGTVDLAGRVGATVLRGQAWHLARVETLDDVDRELGRQSGVTRDTGHVVGGSLAMVSALRPWVSVDGNLQGRFESATRRDLEDGARTLAVRRGVLAGTAGLAFTPWSGRLRIEPVVDLRWLHTEGVDTVGVSPRLAVVGVPVRGLSVRAAVGRYLRPPGLFELYGDRGATLGNPDLVAERGWQADLGARYTAPPGWPVGLDVEVSGFIGGSTDSVAYIQNTQATTIPVNVGRARVAGAEGALRLDVLGWVRSQTGLTVLDARNRSDDPVMRGLLLPRVPRWRLDQRLWVDVLGRASVGWDLSFVDATFSDQANRALEPRRLLHGLFARLAPVAQGPFVEISVHNLTDVRTVVVPADPLLGAQGGTVARPLVDFVGYPLPGRTVFVAVGWTMPRRRKT